jgi:hypothetical protein
MSDPLWELQKGIYGRLTDFTALAAAVGTDDDDNVKIYDHVPQGQEAPYVVIGDDTAIDFDTKTHNGWEVTLTIHCWDFEVAGRKSVKTLMKHIYEALHNCENAVVVAGVSLIFLRCEFQHTYQEQAIEGAGDHYYHGVQRFRALITEN